MNKSKQLYALLAASVLASTATVQANLIINGDFEDHPTLNQGSGAKTWDQFDTIKGWESDSTDDLEIGTQETYDVTGATGVVMELDPNVNVTATSLTAIPAGKYTLTFLYASRGNGTPSQMAPASNTFDVLWGTDVIHVSPTSPAMSTYSVELTSTGVETLAFRGTGTVDSYGALIDDVSLVVVPEPSTYVAGGLALLPLLFGLRSRFAKK